MPFNNITCFFVFISFLFSSQAQVDDISKLQIIPRPAYLQRTEGHFVLNSSTGITYDSEFKISVEFLKLFIENGSNIKLQRNNSISFIKEKSINQPEGYTVKVLPTRIEIKAKTDQGAGHKVWTVFDEIIIN